MHVATLRLAGHDGPELKDARFEATRFPPHFHEAVSIGIVRAGCEWLEVGARTIVRPGMVAVIPARAIHAHGAVDAAPWRYQALYVSPDLVQHRQRRLGATGALGAGVFADPELFAAVAALHDGEPTSARVAALVDQIVRAGVRPAPVAPPAARMDAAAAWIRARLATKLRTDELAASFAMSSYQLARAFRRHHGVTPAAYWMIARLDRARGMLLAGERVAAAAVAVGFYDQSHFVRYFRRYTGVAPNDYRRQARRA